MTSLLFSALVFLHSSNLRPLIHCDIKPDNILLDSNDNPMISDLGFSRKGLKNDESLDVSRVFGTQYYTPKDSVQHKAISTKVDVHCYGVILFELATGKKSHEKDRVPKRLTHFMANVNEQQYDQIQQVIDRSVPNDPACFTLCALMISLGKNCTNEIAENRPDMKQVWLELRNFLSTIVIE